MIDHTAVAAVGHAATNDELGLELTAALRLGDSWDGNADSERSQGC